jgi:uncharacterized protein YjdB
MTARGRVFIAATMLLSGCDEVSGPEATTPVSRVEVSAPATSISVGGTLQLAAAPRAASGEVLNGRAITWSSSDTAIAVVSQAGLVTAHVVGTVTIRASSENRTGEVTLAIQPKAVASVEILPSGEIMQEVGTSRSLALSVRASDGTELSGRPVSWSVSDTSVVGVSTAGVLEARGAGTATLTAQVEGKIATAPVRVFTLVARVVVDPERTALGVGDVRQIMAQAVGSEGIALNRPITWTSSNEAIVTVNAAGRMTGVAPGSAIVTATSQGKSATIDVIVGHWIEYSLQRVGSTPLPATLYTVTRTIGGTSRQERFEATGGSYRRLSGSDRYELRFEGWLAVEGSPAVQATLLRSGVALYDVLNGDLMLFPDGTDAAHDAPQYRAPPVSIGSIALTGRVEAGAEEVTLVFGAQ